MEEEKVEKNVQKEEQGERRRRDGGRRERQTKDNLSEERTFKNYETGEMERVLVTPETEVEAAPSKQERVKQPDEDTFHDTLDKLDDQKEKLWDDFKVYAKQVRQSAYNSTKQEGGETTNLFTDLKDKQAARKDLRNQMKELKATFEAQKKELDAIAEEQSKLRLKMKRLMKKDELEALLGECKYQQANGHMSLYEEKQLCKQIQDLEDSLPFALPLETLEVKRGPLKKAKDTQGKLMKELWAKIDVLTKEIDVLSAEYDTIKKTKNAHMDGIDPAIEKRKKETQDQMDAIKAQKKKVITEYREGCRKYDIQQQVIKKLDWMAQAKVRLVKYKAQLEEEEARRKVQEEERKELQDNVYSEEIRMCQFLIRYCSNFQKKAQQEQAKEAVRDTSCLQNEKLEVVCKKKDVQLDFHVQTKGKKQHRKQEAKPVDDNKISHKLDVLEFFEQMKVTAPTRKQIDDTIKQLEEKEKYFLEQNELKKHENVDVVEEEKKKQRDRENEQKKRESNQERKKKDKRAKMNAQFKEEEYPEM